MVVLTFLVIRRSCFHIDTKMSPNEKNNILFFIIYHHHHHVVPLARISQTLSRHFSLSFIASSRFSGLHPESSHSCYMFVRAGRPVFAWPYAVVHRSVTYELVLASPAVSCMSGSSNLDSCRDGC